MHLCLLAVFFVVCQIGPGYARPGGADGTRKALHSRPDPSLKRQTPRATGSPNLATWAFCPALLPNRSNALRSSS